jgi:hypothetical protein
MAATFQKMERKTAKDASGAKQMQESLLSRNPILANSCVKGTIKVENFYTYAMCYGVEVIQLVFVEA